VDSVGEELKRGESTSQLAGLYLYTHVCDRVGYTYGIPLVSRVLFGALPRKYFPWKDWLEDMIKVKEWNREEYELLWGATFSVIGELYSYGNFIAIILGMSLLGFLTRKLDGFLAPEAPVGVRAIGYVWLSFYFIMFATGFGWALTCTFLNGIPFLGVVLCGKLFGYKPKLDKKPEPRTFAPENAHR
jgi:hypothetical protein